MVDLKKDTWLYALIAAILAIIGVLVPWGSLETAGITAYSWLGGFISNVDGDWVDLSPFINAAGLSVWTLGLTMFSIALLLFYGIHTWKGMEFKWDWLIYVLVGIVLLIFPILTMAMEGTEDAFPIGGIFIIIAGVISITAFALDKFIGGE